MGHAQAHAAAPSPRARRGLGLIRVSKDRDGTTSPEVQQHAIESFSAAQNIEIVGWVYGIDESGSRARSAWWPRLDHSIERLEQGEVDVIVVWRFSRTGRHRLKWAVALDRVDSAGGAILSATEPIETATASGRFARGMLGEMNAYQADLIGETWKDAHARRFREGKPINGKPRFGYAYTPVDGFVPDPITGPVLVEAFRRYIAGESVYSLVAWLNDGPTRPVSGYGVKGDGLWSDRTLRRVMDSGFAAGYITYRGETKRGIHRPLITADEWEAYQEARGRRRTYRRSERSEYVLSGLVWCECGSKMHGGITGGSPQPTYRCKDGHGKRKHPGRYVSERTLETTVRAYLQDREQRIKRDLAEVAKDEPAQVDVDPTDELNRRLAQLAEKQVMLAEQRISMGLPQATYETLRDRYAAEAAALEQELRTVTVRRSAPVRILPVLLERWEDMEVSERREALRAVVRRITVYGDRNERSIDIALYDD